MTSPQPEPSEYERVKIFLLVTDKDGSVSRVPLCLCELCRVNHFLCPRHSAVGEAVLDELEEKIRNMGMASWDEGALLNVFAELRAQQKGEREQE